MFTIGLDYGSLSCRGIIADTSNGEIYAEEEYVYPHGVMSETLPDGTKLPPQYALQDPDDHMNALKRIVRALLKDSGIDPELIEAIGIDSTSSTVLPVDKDFVPLCKKAGFEGNIHAWTKLWKHHAAMVQAEELNKSLREKKLSVLNDYGGNIGVENYIPKIMQVCREAPEVFKETETFIEYCDWLTSYLVGKEVRSGALLTCKALWTPEDGYLSKEFFEQIDPIYAEIPDKLMYHHGAQPIIAWPGEKVANICPEVAAELGLSKNTVVTAPEMDAYAGLPGCGVSKDGTMTMMVGTSTGFMLLSKEKKNVKNICASVKNSILPGYTNYAHGQTSVGDMFDWYINCCVPGSYYEKAKCCGMGIHAYLSSLADKKNPGETGLVALEWWNGKKLDPNLSGLIMGMDLNTKPEDIYRALIEATAYGVKSVIDNYRSFGVAVDNICACGGIAVKNMFLIQIYANVLGMDIQVCRCKQTAALGAAMFAAMAAEENRSFENIINSMSDKNSIVVHPNMEANATYQLLYKEYSKINEIFTNGICDTMKKLKMLRGIGDNK